MMMVVVMMVVRKLKALLMVLVTAVKRCFCCLRKRRGSDDALPVALTVRGSAGTSATTAVRGGCMFSLNCIYCNLKMA